MNRPPLLDVLAQRASNESYIRFRKDWQPGEEDKYFTVKEPISEAVLEAHWLGNESIGVHVMPPGSDTTRLGIIDFDNHAANGSEPPRTPDQFDATFKRIWLAADEQGLSLVPIRTSSQGYHLWAVYGEEVPAGLVRGQLQSVLDAAEVEAEVFPKTDEVGAGGFGNAISLVGGRQSWLLDSNLQPIAREDWISYPLALCPLPVPRADVINERQQIRAPGIIEEIEGGRVYDGNRANTLKTLLVRLRKQNGMDETMLRIVARGFAAEYGLAEKDWTNLVKFASGLATNDIDGFGQLIKIVPKHRSGLTNARYQLEYKGVMIDLDSTSDLMSAAKVRNAIMDQLGDIADITVPAWRLLLPDIVARMVITETVGEDIEHDIWDLLITYIVGYFEREHREFYSQRESLLQGYPVVDGPEVVFKIAPIISWMNRTSTVRVRAVDVLKILRARGVGGSKTFSVNNKNEAVYWIRMDAIEEVTSIAWQLEDWKPVDLATQRTGTKALVRINPDDVAEGDF